jgi:hypothetical protein
MKKAFERLEDARSRCPANVKTVKVMAFEELTSSHVRAEECADSGM